MNVVILLYPDFTALDAVGPYEVFVSTHGAHVQFVAEQAGPVAADTGMLTLVATAAITDTPPPDVLIIPGGPGMVAAMQREPLLAWVRAAHAHARLVLSVCTGAHILGAAGLLADARATTHWGSWMDLANFGATYVRERFVRHGTIITAAGVSAGIDAAIAAVAELTDEPTARAVQLAIEYDPQPPFAMLTPPTTHAELTDHNWRVMQQRSSQRIPIA